MDKIKVFLSSAMTGELYAEREAVRTLFDFNEFLIQMFNLRIIENNASPDNIKETYEHLVNKSDIFILLLNEELREAVLNEYNIATTNQLNVFCYIKENQKRTEKLEQFIENFPYNKHTCKIFYYPQDLVKFIKEDICNDIVKKYLKNKIDSTKKINFENVQVNDLYFSRELLNDLLSNEEIKKMSADDLVVFSNLLIKEYGRYKDALMYLEVALLKEPEKWYIYNNKGFVLHSMGLIDLAIHSYELSRNFSENDVTLYNLGTLYYEKKEYQKAIIYFNLSLKINSDKYNALNYITNCYLNLSEYSIALECAEKAYSINKTDELIIANLALVYAYNNKENEAMMILENINSDNNFYYLKTKLLILNVLNKDDDVLILANQIIKENYRDYDVYKIKFNVLVKLNLINDAIENINEMSKIFVITPSDFNNFGYSLMDKFNLYETAINYFQKAIEINPFIIQAWQNLQVCYAQLEEFDNALDTCDRALSYFPQDSKSLQNKGAILFKIGKFKEGIDVIFEIIPKTLKINEKEINLREFFINMFNKIGLNFELLEEYNKIWNNGSEEEKQKLQEKFVSLQKFIDDMQNKIINSMNIQ
jgi:tetratricopeptide (TPR) repeat protein